MSAPLLLTEGAESYGHQLNHAQCLRGEFGPGVFVAMIDAAGLMPGLPQWVYNLGRVGCVYVQTFTDAECRRGDLWDAESLILFRDRGQYWVAHRMARQLLKATRGNPAVIHWTQPHNVALSIISPRHPYYIEHAAGLLSEGGSEE